MSEYLDAIHEADQELYLTSTALRYLGGAFYQTGNETVGLKLSQLADRIDAANAQIRGAVSQELNRSVQQAQENSATLVQGVMAGIELGQDGSD